MILKIPKSQKEVKKIPLNLQLARSRRLAALSSQNAEVRANLQEATRSVMNVSSDYEEKLSVVLFKFKELCQLQETSTIAACCFCQAEKESFIRFKPCGDVLCSECVQGYKLDLQKQEKQNCILCNKKVESIQEERAINRL